MKQVYLVLFTLLLLLGGPECMKGQPSSLYFLKGVPQTKDLNPARPGIDKGFYISMPLFSKLDLSVNTNNWSYNDLIHRGSGPQADSLVWDFGKFQSALGKKNFLNESAALTLFELGWKKGTRFLAFSWTEHEFAEIFFNKNLVDLVYDGNAPYLGTTYHSGYFGGGSQHYREFAFTYSKDLNRKMSFGITGKVLFGMAGVKTTGMNILAGMPINGNQIDLRATGRVFISAPAEIHLTNNNGYKMYYKDTFDANSYFKNFGNPGFAVDLGFANKVSKEFEFSVSLIDLGFISWRNDLTTLSENGQFLFRGVHTNTQTSTNKPPVGPTDISGLFLALRDSMRNAFFPVEANTGFQTLLPVKLYIAGEYKAGPNLSYGAVARIRMYNNLLHASLTASANAAITEDFSLSASYSVMESTFDNLGLGAACRFGATQLYAATDNVLAFINPAKARNVNLRLGINLFLQRGDKARKGIYKGRRTRSSTSCPL